MTGKELWGSILQKAMEGKLVPQRKEEGTAAELLKEIRKERAKLVKEGKLKKTKPLPAVSEEEKPIDIPDSWEWVRLGEVGDWGSGATPSRQHPEYYGGDIPWLKTGDLNDGYINEIPEYISQEGFKHSSVRLNPIGSILIAMYGATIGKLGILEIPATTNQACCACILYRGVDNQYLYYFLLSHRSAFLKQGAGGAQPNISKAKIINTIMPLPPLPEQHRIVEKLENLKPLVDAYGQAAEELDELNRKFPGDLKKSLLQQAMEGKLVPQRKEEGTAAELLKEIRKERAKLVKEGKLKKAKPLPAVREEEKPFDIPDSWEWVHWGNLAYSIQYGYNAPAKERGKIKFVRISDIQNNQVIWDTVPFCDIENKDIPTYLLHKGDILFARTGGTVGKSFLVDDVPECAVYAGYLIRTRYSSKLNSAFLKFFMNSSLYWKQLRNGTIATAQPNCNGKTLSKMVLPLPPLAEQQRIVKKLESLLALCDKLQPED